MLVIPVISYFFGIYIRMYFDDHAPPHFHVEPGRVGTPFVPTRFETAR